ncbi:hypothetical protein [Desemzia sp. FAM 24101]|uniref:hypothetical protein n=1 Tax=unclassified Desemzia TaxID=2685243 RepID=UPI003887B5A9
MQELYKKLKYFIFCIVFVIFILAPIHVTHAEFSDSVTEAAGIKLKLGNIDLAVKDSSDSQIVTLEKNQNQIQLKETIQNKGSLTGKLAYRVLFKNTITKEVKIQNDYVVLTNSSNGNSLHLNPNESTEVSLNIDVTSVQNQINNTEVQIEFLLFQTNGTLKKPMFYDEITISYNLILDKEGGEVTIPPKEDPNDYWPTSGWIDHGNVRYNKEDYSPIMYFSEMKNSKQIKNLNDNIFYVEIKDEKGIELTDLAIRSPEDMIIKVEQVNGNKQHLKITISIDKAKFKRTVLSVPIYDYSIASYTKNTFELSEEDAPITLKRILLSTDEAGTRTFNVRPVNLFAEERQLYLAQTKQDSTGYLNKDLTKISFNKSPEISVEVSGNNKELVEAKKIQAEENSFALKPKSKAETKKAGMKLSMFLKGTSGEILEVTRDIQLLPTTNEATWPNGMSTNWGTPDGKGNYREEATFNLQVADKNFVSTNSISIYVNNLYKEELQYIPPNSANFVKQTIFYSPSGEYMKIDLKFISNNLDQNSLPTGFNFSILREKDINTSNQGYINDQPVSIKYTMPKKSAQYSQNKITVEQPASDTEVSYEKQLIQSITNGEKEISIDYDQLPSDFGVIKVEDDVRTIMNSQGIKIDFTIKDDPELKAIKLIVQE